MQKCDCIGCDKEAVVKVDSNDGTGLAYNSCSDHQVVLSTVEKATFLAEEC